MSNMNHTGTTKPHKNYTRRNRFHGSDSMVKFKYDRNKGKNHRKKIENIFISNDYYAQSNEEQVGGQQQYK